MTNNALIEALPETDQAKKGFYPTPKDLAAKLLDGPDWKMVNAVLEPSAGKGDLAEAVKQRIIGNRGYYARERLDLDCIEIDPNLRHILTGKEFRVVHDDFLTFESYKVYDAIIMNPPFDRGADHLLKALDMQRNGGYIACILNAQTLRNPHTYAQQTLVDQLSKNGAEITYIDGAFADAERKTGVSIAIVKVTIPRDEEDDSSILDCLKMDRKRREEQRPPTETDVIKDDFIEAIIDRFNFEAELGCRMIREYRALKPYIKGDIKEDHYTKPMMKLVLDSQYNDDATENGYLQILRKKYWTALFTDPKFTHKLTNNLQNELMSMVNELVDYDFTFYNIMTIRQSIEKKVVSGIHDTIITLFDEWTRKFHWDEQSKNLHYFNGWKTNDAFAVNKRVIIPFYHAYDNWDNRFKPTHYEALRKLSDIEKVFDFLSGRTTQHDLISGVLQLAEREGQTKKIQLKYFKVTFYKKGTCHMEFTDMDVLHKFNLYAAKDKNWLPPSYGKKAYADMCPEEQDVIDSFEGADSYADVLKRADYFLSGPADTGLVKIAAPAVREDAQPDEDDTQDTPDEMTLDEFIQSIR